MVWQRPGLIGNPGWLRSSAWIWLFSSSEKHHRMGRQIDIEPDNVGELGGKLGSRERLKVRSRCGCNLCARQMRCTEPSEMPMALAIARPVQWVAWCRGAVQSVPPRKRWGMHTFGAAI